MRIYKDGDSFANPRTGVIHTIRWAFDKSAQTLCGRTFRTDHGGHHVLRKDAITTCEACRYSLGLSYRYSRENPKLPQEAVKVWMESLAKRTKTFKEALARDFGHVSRYCEYRKRNTTGRSPWYGCGKIKTPSMHLCTLKNCPYLG